ncbi:MAG TPA: polysaccharide deacetylase family protein [Bacteroidia bacterium]|nr:polysaccharide deacetylase family protein [Bacteroidia bacterium]
MQNARVPGIVQLFFPGMICRIPEKDKKTVYLTFDDGPIPEATPMVLDILNKYNAKATFFCVGDNVRKYPQLYQRILDEGHAVGNHTFNHTDGWKTKLKEYIENTEKCAELVSSPLFRPPYGRIKIGQYNKLQEKYKIVMWDVLTRDYDADFSVSDCFSIVEKNIREGSILVFHDSIKAKDKLSQLLPQTLEFIASEGYAPKPISVPI